MKTMTCECGHVEEGVTENDVASKMESHLKNAHADRAGEHNKMMAEAKKTLKDSEV